MSKSKSIWSTFRHRIARKFRRGKAYSRAELNLSELDSHSSRRRFPFPGRPNYPVSFKSWLCAALTLTLVACAQEDALDEGFLRDYAAKVKDSCTNYFAAIEGFVSNTASQEATVELSGAMDGLVNSLADMNSAVLVEYGEDAPIEVTAVLNKLLNPENLNESEVRDVLSITIKEECAKWTSFADLSDGEIMNYFASPSVNKETSSETFCEKAREQAAQIDTPVPIEVKGCSVQDDNQRRTLVLELNNWLEWVDFEDPERIPNADGLKQFIFDYPFEILLEGFRSSGSAPESFDEILIVINDEANTVYAFNPRDVKTSLEDTRPLRQVLLDLRDVVQITSS